MEQTLVKGLALLEALAANPQVSGVTELAKSLGVTKSNAHRLLQTLAARGYVRNVDGTGKYALTLKLFELGALVVEELDLKSIGRDFVESLGAATSESVHLSVLEGTEVIYIDKADSSHAVRAYSRVGGRAPAHCVATGKAMLAHAPPQLVSAACLQLTPQTVDTITSPKKFLNELETVRQIGYAVNRGEWRPGVWGIAAPIWDASGKVCAAIGLSGPAERFKPKSIKQFAPLVIDAARQISRLLGYRPPTPLHGELMNTGIETGAVQPRTAMNN